MQKRDEITKGELKEILKNPLLNQKLHEILSTRYFNNCWKFIDETEKTSDDVENMILLAYSSLWHWKQRKDYKPVNLSVGYWLVSRVHALAGHYEMAKFWGEKCLKISLENNLSPFYVGYAYEALARAELLGKNSDLGKDFLNKAQKELEKIENTEEREFLYSDISSLMK